VSYASHELKTPLSTIRGLVDLGIKTKDINKTGPKIKKTLTEITNLLDSLLLITKREFSDIKKEEVNIMLVIKQVVEELKQQYKEKNISYTNQLPEEYTVS
jgi:signal transduction histidine kinase